MPALIDASVLVLAALAGIAGTWSPCGLSAIETIVAPEAGGASRRRRAAALAAFTLGAVAGGVAIFTALGLVGALTIGSAGTVAIVVLAAAGLADAAGLPVVPRIARQVPEGWRRRYPLPLAALLYGGLLGLGLTTYVMSYALWAALLVVLALADPALAAAAGVAFGLGRAVPVVLLAAGWERSWADRALDTMLGRPASLRLARGAAGVAALCGAAVLALPPGQAAGASIPNGYAPDTDGATLAYSTRTASIVVWPDGTRERLPGTTDASVGGGRLAWRVGDLVTVVEGDTRETVAQLEVPGVDGLSVDGEWLVLRRTRGARTTVEARDLRAPGSVRTVVAGAAGTISRPSVAAGTLVVARARARSSEILAARLPGGAPRPIRRSGPGVDLRGASVEGGRIAWIEADYCHQRVMVGPLRGTARARVARWRSTATRDGGFEAGFVDEFNSASGCPPRGARGGGGRLRILAAAVGDRGVYVSAMPSAGGPPRLIRRR